MAGVRWVLLLLSVAWIAGCAEHPVQESMAAFDRAYIPALMLTRDRDPTGQSVMAIKNLKLQWTVLKSKNPGLADDGGPANDAEPLIMRADSLINAGKHSEAHKLLEQVRDIMYEARMEEKIKYFPDRLTEFHSVLKRIVEVAPNPAKVSRHMPDAIASWEAVSKARIDGKSFRMPKERVKRIKKLIAREADALAALSAAASSNNRKKVSELTVKVKKNFITIYRIFGDFGAASL